MNRAQRRAVQKRREATGILYSKPGRPDGICVLCDKPASGEFNINLAPRDGEPVAAVFEFCSAEHLDTHLWEDAQRAAPLLTGPNPFVKGDPAPNAEAEMFRRYDAGEITMKHLRQWTQAQKAVTV